MSGNDFVIDVDGINVAEAILDSAVRLPLVGVVKPCVIIERNVIEKMIRYERFKTELFTVAAKYLPDFTIRFMR